MRQEIIAELKQELHRMEVASQPHEFEKHLYAMERLVWEKAVSYQMYHALGLMAVGILVQATGAPLLGAAGWLMLLGIIFFSGSLYILAVSGISILGAITPIGGVLYT